MHENTPFSFFGVSAVVLTNSVSTFMVGIKMNAVFVVTTFKKVVSAKNKDDQICLTYWVIITSNVESVSGQSMLRKHK